MRSTENQYIEDGRRILSRSGKEYELKKFKTNTITNVWGVSRTYAGYNVCELPQGEVIGSVTNYTTESRLFSLLERYERPAAMQPVQYIAKVRGTNDRRLYCAVGYAREWANIRIDDAFDIEITTKDGLTISDPVHHLSLMKTSPIVELTRLRRYSRIRNKDGSFRIYSQKEYDRLGPRAKNDLLLQPNQLISIRLIPTPGAQNYFFADDPDLTSE